MNYDGADGLELGAGSKKLDPSVFQVLPQGCRVVSTSYHGASFWADTGRIDVELIDGTLKTYFIKVLSQNVGKHMVHGEFESMKAIHALLPEFVPKPVAWGTYNTIPNTHFFLCEFLNMTDAIPDAKTLSAHLAELHQISRSPTGKFGFHITTYRGNLPQTSDWEQSWEVFFTKNLKLALDMEIEAKGHDPELETLTPVIFNEVIPRLLHPLESGGRTIKPSLVHGDLWYANAGVDGITGAPLIFDASCFFAHNEYEFGQWKPACNKFGPEYREAYHAIIPISEPVEDYEGRLDLYKLKFNTHVSALFREDMGLRRQVIDDMKDLVERYGTDSTARSSSTS